MPAHPRGLSLEAAFRIKIPVSQKDKPHIKTFQIFPAFIIPMRHLQLTPLPTRGKGIFYAIVSSATFGLIPLFSLGPLRNGMGGSSILFYRCAIAAVLFGGMALLRGIRLRPNRRQLFELFVLGGLCYCGSAGFLLLSYLYIPTGVATTINFLFPVVVALLMRFVFGEPMPLRTLLAIGLSLVGVGLLSWTGGALLDWRGVASAMMTVLCYGFYIVGLNKMTVRKLPGSVVTFYVLLFSAVSFAVLALCSGGINPIGSWSDAFDLTMLAVVATIVSNLTLVLAVQAIGSTLTAVLGSMEPLTAVGVGLLVFHEHLVWNQFFGIVLVVLSVGLVVFKGTHRKERAA